MENKESTKIDFTIKDITREEDFTLVSIELLDGTKVKYLEIPRGIKTDVKTVDKYLKTPDGQACIADYLESDLGL